MKIYVKDGLKGRSRERDRILPLNHTPNGLRMVGSQHLVGMNKCV
jgi:hypothetical protein